MRDGDGMQPTHRYTGPAVNNGIRANADVIIIGKRAGGKLVRDIANRGVYLVGAKQLQPIQR